TVTVPSASLTSGSSFLLTLQARDAAGNALTTGGFTVAFSLSGGTSTGTIGTTTDLNNGRYAASVTGVLAGMPVTVGATIGGAAVTSTLPTVTVTPGAAASITKSGGDLLTGAISTTLATPHEVLVADAAGNPVAGTATVWAAATGSGSDTPDHSTTDANGHATTVR